MSDSVISAAAAAAAVPEPGAMTAPGSAASAAAASAVLDPDPGSGADEQRILEAQAIGTQLYATQKWPRILLWRMEQYKEEHIYSTKDPLSAWRFENDMSAALSNRDMIRLISATILWRRPNELAGFDEEDYYGRIGNLVGRFDARPELMAYIVMNLNTFTDGEQEDWTLEQVKAADANAYRAITQGTPQKPSQ